MKRRNFLAGFASAATLPMMPAKAFSGATAAHVVPDLYAKAAQWAGMWNHSSVSMLKHQFGLDDAGARGLFDRLVANQVVAKPDARGMARVVSKTYDSSFVTAKMQEFLLQKTAPTPVKTLPKPARHKTLNAPKAEPGTIDLKSKLLDEDHMVDPDTLPEEEMVNALDTTQD